MRMIERDAQCASLESVTTEFGYAHKTDGYLEKESSPSLATPFLCERSECVQSHRD